jgi:hypothetical protein
VGDEVHLSKKDDKWIKCMDLECFKEQGGEIKEKKEWKGRKRLTAEEARSVSKQLWAFALEDSKTPLNEGDLDIAKIFYKGMIELMK